MKGYVVHRMLGAVGLSAAVLVGLVAATDAQGERAQGRQEDQEDTGRQEPTTQVQRRAEQEQHDLIRQHELRLPQYRVVLDQQQRAGEQRAAQLREQKRNELYRYLREYLVHLREQRSRLEGLDRHDYDRDPFFHTPSTYRYLRAGGYHETNQYGLDLLRQAVSDGYEQGYHAGRADRDDGWWSNYEDCFAYQDANYGYGGFYVDRDDYRYFFREGFRRGYEDGYGGRHVYSSASDGKVAILATVVAGIIGHELIQ